MASPGVYSAGQATLTLKPALSAGFRQQVKGLLAPIDESLKVSIKPQLASGFKTQLRGLVKGASDGVNATVGVKVDTKSVRAQLKAQTKDLPDLKLGVELNFRRADAQLATWRRSVERDPITLRVNTNSAVAVAQLGSLRAMAERINDQINGSGRTALSSSTTALTSSQSRATGNIITRPIRAYRIQVEVDKASLAKAQSDLAGIQSKLATARRAQGDAADKVTLAETRFSEVMSRGGVAESTRIAATQNLARARRTLADSAGHVTSLLEQERQGHARVSEAERVAGTATSALQAAFRGFGQAALSGIQSAAKQMFSFSNIVTLAGYALVGLAAVSLVPLIGQLAQAAGVAALLPAAIAGAVSVFAALKIGTMGIADAFKAAGKASDDAGKSAKEHADKVASAQKEARSAARSVEEAQKGVRDAERGVRDAQKESLNAQKDLNRARKEAVRDLQDINRELSRAKLDEEGAAISVAEARMNLIKTMQDPNANPIDRARALHDVKVAEADQQDAKVNTQRTSEDAADANAKGVEGSDKVINAKDRVEKAAQGEADAQERVVEANQRLSDANENLTDAQRKLTEAINDTGNSADEFKKKMDNLSANAQDFVTKLLALKPQLKDFKNAVQDALFDKLGDSASKFTTNWLPTMKSGLSGIASEINNGLRRALSDLDTDATRSKVSHIFDNVKLSIGPAIDGINNLVQGLLSLAGVGSDFLPGISQGFLGLTEKFRQWAESPEGQAKFHDFLENALTTFQKIIDIARDLGGVIKEIFKGSDDTGKSWLDSLDATFKRWSDFLATPEGQQKIKDFFDQVRQTVSDIIDLLTTASNMLGDLSGIAGGLGFFSNQPKKSSGSSNKTDKGKTDNSKSDPAKTGSGKSDSKAPAAKMDNGKPAPGNAEPGKGDNNGVDQSRTTHSFMGGTRYFDKNGNSVDADGNPIVYSNSWFPGFKKDSFGGQLLSIESQKMHAPGRVLGALFGDDDKSKKDKTPQSTGIQPGITSTGVQPGVTEPAPTEVHTGGVQPGVTTGPSEQPVRIGGAQPGVTTGPSSPPVPIGGAQPGVTTGPSNQAPSSQPVQIGGVQPGVTTPPAQPDEYAKTQQAFDAFSKSLEDKSARVNGILDTIKTKIGELGAAADSTFNAQLVPGLDNFANKLPIVRDGVNVFTGDVEKAWKHTEDYLTDSQKRLTGDGFLEPLKRALGALPDFFAQLVTGIGAKWSQLPNVAVAPINSLIDMWNQVGDLWNKVADLVKLPDSGKWTPMGRIGGAQPGVTAPGRWMGGPVYGPGGGTDDKAGLYRLSNGEHVWTKAEVDAAGGHQNMYKLRKQVLSSGGQQAQGPNYAVGGGVEFGSDADRWMADVIQKAFSNATITSALRPNETGFHRTGQAIDIDGPKQDIANWIYDTYPQSTQLIYGPGPLLYNARGYTANPANQGELRGIYANDLAAHFDHVHWANIAPLQALSPEQRKDLFGRITSRFSSGRNVALQTQFAQPLKALADAIPNVPGIGKMGEIPKAMATRIADELISFVSGAAGASSAAVNYDPNGGAEQWRSLAMDAMRRTGFNADDPNQVNAMLAQITSESHGDPNIIQQVKDVNSGGNEAQGLLQVIPGTFAAYRDPSLPDDRTDPLANMVAALNYYRSAYGNDLTTEWGHGHGYDQGGIFKHGTFGWNTSGLPEAVLTNPQWNMFKEFIGRMPGMSDKLQNIPLATQPGAGTGKNSQGQDVPLNGPVGSPQRLFGDFAQQLGHSINPALPEPGVDTSPEAMKWATDNPGIDTGVTLANKTVDRFKGAFDSGLNDMISANLGPLGIPDPRTIPVVKGLTDYGNQLDAWNKAKIANAQATAALGQSGYNPQAAASPVGTANVVIGGGSQDANGGSGAAGVTYDYSTHIQITPADPNNAIAQAQRLADLRALTHTSRG